MSKILFALPLLALGACGLNPNAPIGEQMSGFDPSKMTPNQLCVMAASVDQGIHLIADAAKAKQIDVIGTAEQVGTAVCAQIAAQGTASTLN